jgi:hypothetical protein
LGARGFFTILGIKIVEKAVFYNKNQKNNTIFAVLLYIN